MSISKPPCRGEHRVLFPCGVERPYQMLPPAGPETLASQSHPEDPTFITIRLNFSAWETSSRPPHPLQSCQGGGVAKDGDPVTL